MWTNLHYLLCLLWTKNCSKSLRKEEEEDNDKDEVDEEEHLITPTCVGTNSVVFPNPSVISLLTQYLITSSSVFCAFIPISFLVYITSLEL